jgi:hypothetical protein
MECRPRSLKELAYASCHPLSIFIPIRPGLTQIKRAACPVALTVAAALT